MRQRIRVHCPVLAGWILALSSFPSYGVAIAPGSILATVNDTLLELAPDGTTLQSFAVPYPGGDSPVAEIPRGVQVAQDGSVLVFNGTFAPYLSRLDPVTGAWSHATVPDWYIANSGALGAVASMDGYAFVANDSAQARAFRFALPSLGEAGQISADSTGLPVSTWTDWTAGLDGNLYALEGEGGTRVFVYDPLTLAFQRTIDLSSTVGSNDARAIAVNQAGDIFLADFTSHELYRLSATGQVLDSTNYCFQLPGIFLPGCDPVDIAVSADGRLVVGYRFGDLVITDETFSNPHLVQVGETTQNVHVAIAPVPLPSVGWLLAPAFGLVGWLRRRMPGG